jgi:hypothetical protein
MSKNRFRQFAERAGRLARRAWDSAKRFDWSLLPPWANIAMALIHLILGI